MSNGVREVYFEHAAAHGCAVVEHAGQGRSAVAENDVIEVAGESRSQGRLAVIRLHMRKRRRASAVCRRATLHHGLHFRSGGFARLRLSDVTGHG